MPLNKKIKVIAFSTLGLCMLLFITLIVHIAVMVKGKNPVSPTIQMARIDFKQDLDSLQIVTIEQHIRAREGVKSTFFNPESKILIYTFDNRLNNSLKIYQEAVQPSGIAAKRYIPSFEDLKFGCPVTDKNSFYGRLTNMVASIIN